MIVINGKSTAGTPLGTKILKYLKPCLIKPITVIATNINNAKIKDSILFVGLGKTFQIWEPKNFEKFKAFARKKAFQNRSNLKWDNK